MNEQLTPKPGHVVAVTTLPTCDICGEEPASWDVRTRFGPWANACDACVLNVAAVPGETGVGIGQRLVLERDVPKPFTVGAVLAHKRERAAREAREDDGLRAMLVPDRVPGVRLVTDPVRIPEPITRQTSQEMGILADVRGNVRKREARSRQAREALEIETAVDRFIEEALGE